MTFGEIESGEGSNDPLRRNILCVEEIPKFKCVFGVGSENSLVSRSISRNRD